MYIEVNDLASTPSDKLGKKSFLELSIAGADDIFLAASLGLFGDQAVEEASGQVAFTPSWSSKRIPAVSGGGGIYTEQTSRALCKGVFGRIPEGEEITLHDRGMVEEALSGSGVS